MGHAARRVARRPSSVLVLSVQYGIAKAALPPRQRIVNWAKAALMINVQVTVRLVGAREGRALNRDFRGEDHATNVLTFAYPGTDPLSGDIILCAPIIAREAREQRKSRQAHYAHLVVHGMLHLQGFDHENSKDAAIMERLEAEIVAKLGYAHPYEIRRAESGRQ
jgi:probable rRNA maturation factor